jgi:hypothetical protein
MGQIVDNLEFALEKAPSLEQKHSLTKSAYPHLHGGLRVAICNNYSLVIYKL